MCVVLKGNRIMVKNKNEGWGNYRVWIRAG